MVISSSQDTHVNMLTALVEKRRDCIALVSPYRSVNRVILNTNR